MTMHTPPVALALLLSMAFGAVPRLGTVAQSSGAEARVSAQSAEIGASVDVFVGGVGTHPVYRIPAVTRLATGPKSGRLLAFAEGRPELADVVDNDLVLATSDDGGATWSAPRTIAELANRSLNNPCVVEVREGAHAGRVLLVFQSYPEKHGEHHAVEGYGNDADATSADERVCRSYIVHSDDAGATWSAPREITRSVKRPARATSTASGPGIGIQLAHGAHRGRVLIPFNEGPFDQWRVYAASSDDGGDSWRFGEVAPNDAKGLANEVQMFERADGTVVLNARQHLGAKRRKVAESRDGACRHPRAARSDLHGRHRRARRRTRRVHRLRQRVAPRARHAVDLARRRPHLADRAGRGQVADRAGRLRVQRAGRARRRCGRRPVRGRGLQADRVPARGCSVGAGREQAEVTGTAA
jgi:hypothetical protein